MADLRASLSALAVLSADEAFALGLVEAGAFAADCAVEGLGAAGGGGVGIVPGAEIASFFATVSEPESSTCERGTSGASASVACLRSVFKFGLGAGAL
jgi:hypothetical protein